MRIAGVMLAALTAACSQSTLTPTGPTPLAVVGNAPQTGTPVPDPLPPTSGLGATRFLAFGDSITCGTPGYFPSNDFAFDDPECHVGGGSPQYPQLARTLLLNATSVPNIVLDNEGRPGEMASSAYSRFVGLMSSRRPQGVLLLEGINDLNNGRSISAAVNAIGSMIEVATLYNATVLVGTMFQTCLSVNPHTGRVRPNSTDLIGPFNAALAGVVSGRPNVYLVDVHGAFGTNNCLSDRGTNYLGEDGLHPSPSGYSRLASTFANAVTQRFAVRGSFQ